MSCFSATGGELPNALNLVVTLCVCLSPVQGCFAASEVCDTPWSLLFTKELRKLKATKMFEMKLS